MFRIKQEFEQKVFNRRKKTEDGRYHPAFFLTPPTPLEGGIRNIRFSLSPLWDLGANLKQDEINNLIIGSTGYSFALKTQKPVPRTQHLDFRFIITLVVN